MPRALAGSPGGVRDSPLSAAPELALRSPAPFCTSRNRALRKPALWKRILYMERFCSTLFHSRIQ